MKSIVSFQLLDNPSVTIKPDIGFIKLYFKNNILTSKNSTGLEKNLVLDTLLTGLSISPVSIPIVATDSIIQAFGKLQGSINTLTSSIPTDISDLTDTTGIIPTNTSDLVNDSGFITLGDIPTIPSDISELTDATDIIPTNTSDLINDSGFIAIGDVSNTIVTNDDVDDTNIATGKILQVGADGVTHEYVDMPSGGSSIHNNLSDRDAADAHPIPSITGLASALAGKQAKATYQTITIAVADWTGGTTCTKSVTGVTSTTWNSFAFAESYREKIIEFDVRPSGQGTGTITFTADSTPDAEIVLTVEIKEV